MLLPRMLGCLALLLSLAASGARAEPAGYRKSLFTGENLDGRIVTGSEVVARDGVLWLKSGNGFVRTHHRYADFVLELKCRALGDQDWDSGIYFRSELPLPGRAWPERYQIDLRKGLEGNLVGRPETSGRHLILPGQWNHLKLTVVGAEAALEINGRAAWKVAGLEARDGYLGLQSQVPEGGQFEFQDILVTELGYRSLFNGLDLSGWEGGSGDAASCWKAQGETLVCTGQTGTWLRSQDKFGDFNLRLEYKLLPGGNSGVYVRVPADGNHHGPGSGIEVQILDDSAERYRNLKPYQFSASLYAIVPAEPQVARPPGEWSTLEINCREKSYRVIHNGIEVVNAAATAVPELESRLVEGFLGLQNHSEEVWFRHLRWGPPQ